MRAILTPPLIQKFNKMTYTLTAEQLDILIEQKVTNMLEAMGHIPTHITARAAWKICGSRARFEHLVEIGQIKPIMIAGYKAPKYLRSDVVRASKGVKNYGNTTKKIKL